MAWFADTTSAPKIRTQYKKSRETIQYTFADSDGNITPVGGAVRTRTIITDRHPGMTKAAAEAACDSQASGTNVVDVHIERINAADGYAFVKTTDSKGTWA